MGRYTTYTAWLPNTTSAQSYLFWGLTSTTMATGTIQSMETRHEDLVHGYLSKRYVVPITTTVGSVKTIIEDLVTYDIYRLVYQADGQTERNLSIENRYKIAIGWLSDISQGKADLFDNSGTAIPIKNSTDKFFINSRDYAPTFEMDSPVRWGVSTRRLNDIETLRDNDR